MFLPARPLLRETGLLLFCLFLHQEVMEQLVKQDSAPPISGRRHWTVFPGGARVLAAKK